MEHYESTFTKFFQAYYLPEKFGYDKRRAHLASLVISGQINRESALAELKLPLYDDQDLKNDMNYWLKKLGVTQIEFDEIMKQKPKFYYDYPNNEKRVALINKLLGIAAKVRRFILNFGKVKS